MASDVAALPRALRRWLGRDRTVRRWAAAWLGAAVLGVVNGAVRETAYRDRVGEEAANQISAASLGALLAAYFWALERRWPIDTTRTAFGIGGIWGALTVLFEFGFGHWVDEESWSELLENYDVRSGNLWPLVLAWIVVGPAAVRAARRGAG